MRAGRVQWLIVPRHPQRFDEVAALVAAARLHACRAAAQWSGAAAERRPMSGSATRSARWRCITRLADVALLGGSFAPLGGQNLIEAAACGCPVVMGPHTFNFAEAAELAQEAGAALRVADMEEGVRIGRGAGARDAAAARAGGRCRRRAGLRARRTGRRAAHRRRVAGLLSALEQPRAERWPARSLLGQQRVQPRQVFRLQRAVGLPQLAGAPAARRSAPAPGRAWSGTAGFASSARRC